MNLTLGGFDSNYKPLIFKPVEELTPEDAVKILRADQEISRPGEETVKAVELAFPEGIAENLRQWNMAKERALEMAIHALEKEVNR